MTQKTVTTMHLPVPFIYPRGRTVECWLGRCLLSTHWIKDPETPTDHQRRLDWTADQHKVYREAPIGQILKALWYDRNNVLVNEEHYQKKEQDLWERLT